MAPLRTRFLIVHNPNAGQRTRHLYERVIAHLEHRGCKLDFVEIARHGEGIAAAAAGARSKRFDAIVAAGGDGTIHDVAEGVLGHSTPLGIVPIGTANVFAGEIKLPRSPEMLAQMLCHGEARGIPVGAINGRPFLFVAGVGFDAEAVRIFEKEGSRKFGRAGFVWPVTHALFSYQDRLLRVETDRGQTDAQWVIVTRAKRYAANLMLAPLADLHQPTFFVLQMRGNGTLIRMSQLAALAIGCLRYFPGVTLEPASWVRIDGDRSTPVQIDGEVLGKLPLTIKPNPRTLSIIMP
jgi:diacylglycerol kinase (ATP)